jgi:hypothetical protein
MPNVLKIKSPLQKRVFYFDVPDSQVVEFVADKDAG